MGGLGGEFGVEGMAIGFEACLSVRRGGDRAVFVECEKS
jgi:hypothetical protein